MDEEGDSETDGKERRVLLILHFHCGNKGFYILKFRLNVYYPLHLDRCVILFIPHKLSACTIFSTVL